MLDEATRKALYGDHRNPKDLDSLDEFAEKHPNHDGEWTPDQVAQYYTIGGVTELMFKVCNMILLDGLVGTEESMHAPVCCHVRYDSKPIIQKVAELYHRKPYTEVWLGGNEGEKRGGTEKYAVWEGAISWTEKLMAAGVRRDRIKYADGVYNTPDEHLEFIRLAQENKWPVVHLVGAPYHMVRIALGAIQHMKRVGFWTKMHFHAPRVLDWQEEVLGAQGIKFGDGERYNQLDEEYVRIPEYMLKTQRDLASFNDAIAYMRYGRNSIVDGQLTQPLELSMAAG